MEEKISQNKAIRKFVADNYPTEDDGKTLTIRTGEAEKIRYRNKVSISGTISAPSKFFLKRVTEHDPKKSHVVFDKQDGYIKLVLDEMYEKENYEIFGKLNENPELSAFGINKNKTYTTKELMQFLKMNRIHFVDKEANSKIVLSLQNFKAKVEQQIEDSSNQRGNQTKSVVQKLEMTIDEKFILSIPIFKGMEQKSFSVDIYCNITDGDIQFYLESKELKELQLGSMSAIIDEELKYFSDIVCIEK